MVLIWLEDGGLRKKRLKPNQTMITTGDKVINVVQKDPSYRKDLVIGKLRIKNFAPTTLSHDTKAIVPVLKNCG
jgi:hypothetical protein